ncbi:ATP-binding protein, partial [Streptomyces formicae]
MPDSHEGHRLAAALQAYRTPSADSADTEASTGQTAAAGAPVHAPAEAASGHAQDDGDDDADGMEDGLKAGDEEDEPEGHVFPALKILKDAVGRSKMHPIPVFRK